MKIITQKGFSFGFSSGIITTLGLMVGLFASTSSKLVVLGGILTIAVADAFSDALSIHMSEEIQGKQTHKKIWYSTLMAFIAKLIFAMIFVIPILIFDLTLAIVINISIGLTLLSLFNLVIAQKTKRTAWKVIFEHLLITVIVISLTSIIGLLISKYFV